MYCAVCAVSSTLYFIYLFAVSSICILSIYLLSLMFCNTRLSWTWAETWSNFSKGGWYKFGCKCYQVSNALGSWNKSRELCVSDGADLVVSLAGFQLLQTTLVLYLGLHSQPLPLSPQLIIKYFFF
uniref:C-type lectin domain-containing protein n=1 Tax=Gadus morhua TaxID=8049 RepID=A0A8C5FG00_GADMO